MAGEQAQPRASESLPAFEVVQPRVQDFFHAPQLSPPQIAHVVEALVDSVEALVDSFEALVDCGKAFVDFTAEPVKPFVELTAECIETSVQIAVQQDKKRRHDPEVEQD